MYTTLNKLRKHGPCADGLAKLLDNLGKGEADDEPLSIITILESNGLEDALWALRAVDGYDREIRLYAVWCARQVQHLMTDQRSLDALDVAEKYANGDATDEELQAARAAAVDAAKAAGWDAARAARAAGWAAREAAWTAARAAAWEAAGWAAARDEQAAELRRWICAALEGKADETA